MGTRRRGVPPFAIALLISAGVHVFVIGYVLWRADPADPGSTGEPISVTPIPFEISTAAASHGVTDDRAPAEVSEGRAQPRQVPGGSVATATPGGAAEDARLGEGARPGGAPAADVPLASGGVVSLLPRESFGGGVVGGSPPAGQSPESRERAAVLGAELPALSRAMQAAVKGKGFPGDAGGDRARSHLQAALVGGGLSNPVPEAVPLETTDPRITGSSGAGDLADRRTQMLRLRAAADGPSEPLFSVRIALVRGSPGNGLGVELLRSSGSTEHDKFVAANVSAWLRRLTEEGRGLEALSRIVLDVETFVHFRRDVSELDPGDAAGVAATAGLSSVHDVVKGVAGYRDGQPLIFSATGVFDDATGKVEAINLLRPNYRWNVRLVEAR